MDKDRVRQWYQGNWGQFKFIENDNHYVVIAQASGQNGKWVLAYNNPVTHVGGGGITISDIELRLKLLDMFGEFYVSKDHWIPVSYFSEDNPRTVTTNIIPLCCGLGGCNNSKGCLQGNVWLEKKFGKRKGKQIAARIQEYFDSIEE